MWYKTNSNRYTHGMSILEQKLLQYDVITEEFEPVVEDELYEAVSRQFSGEKLKPGMN